MSLFANYEAEFAFLPNSMDLHRSSTPSPFHRRNPPYPSYSNIEAVKLL